MHADDTPTDGPGIQIDSDWKAQAQAEKERLAAKEAERDQQQAAAGPGKLPEANFRTLVQTLGMQAVMGLGTQQDPKSGGIIVDLEGSQFAIDLLGVLEEKTKGNLTDEESSELTGLLGDLRARYVQIHTMVAQAAAEGKAGAGAATPGATETGGASKIITP